MFAFDTKVRDKVTGFVGVVTARAEYITGCRQSLIQPPIDKDGKWVEAHWFDVDRLVAVEKTDSGIEKTAVGGDISAPIK